MSAWWKILSRRKHVPQPISQDDPLTSSTGSINNEPRLARVLTTLDLTALGVGSTLGVGVYVLAGQVAKNTAGPSVILSFLIAAIASVFAGLCYAEFGARVPKAGSAYIYSYATVGEFIAFVIGWNLILEYVIGSASVAKGLSVYLDTLLNDTMRNAFIEIAPIHSTFLSTYFDFFSFGITLLLGAALAFGLKESSIVNNIFTLINIVIVLFVVIAGSMKAKPEFWNIKKSTIPPEYNGGEGGFFPFGIAGTIKGAATCFYGFVGFDCIATTGEEVKNPKRAIPISIITSLFIIFLSYFGTSTVITLMVPYYLQDSDAPIPWAFALVGWDWAKWIVSIGGIFGLCASLFGAMFPLPRIIYAMANDGLVFRFLGSINSKFRTPIYGTFLAAILTGLMSALFDLKQLVNMMSIGTLLAYSIVAACVIILRYSEEGHIYETNPADYTENLNLIPPPQNITIARISKQMFNFSKRDPTYLSQKLVTILVFIFSILCLTLASLISFLQPKLETGDLEVVIPIGIVVLLMLIVLIAMYAQPTSNANLSFKVPLVPLIPALSICINLYLMMMLDSNTWIRFGVWMAIGLPIYLISSCILYKKPNQKSGQKPTQNGHVNNAYIHENGKNLLTIPEILVEAPNPTLENEEIQNSETNTNSDNRERTFSVDSNDLNNALLEIDKVLNDTEMETSENYEAINPENEYKNSMVLVKNLNDDTLNENSLPPRVSICSTDSESDHSKEHHVEAQIHQEDSDELNDEDLNSSVEETPFAEQTSSEGQILSEEQTSSEGQILSEEQTPSEEQTSSQGQIISEEQTPSEERTPKEQISFKEGTTSEEQISSEEQTSSEKQIPSETQIPSKEETTELELQTSENPTNVEQVEEQVVEESKEEAPSKEDMFTIPLPPPIENLLSNSPVTPKLAFKIDFNEVTLKAVPIPAPRTRSESISNEGPSDNVKLGSTEYDKLKLKLNDILKSRQPLKFPERKIYIEDTTPSPAKEQESIELIESVLEQFEEIPEDFGKTKEFKDVLNNLLSRKHSNKVIKPEHTKKYEKNNENATKTAKTDEVHHKKQMADTLRSIKSLTDNKKIRELETHKDSTPEKDQETHKRLMVATFRSIKLRRTGLPLTDDDRRESREERANIDKANISNS